MRAFCYLAAAFALGTTLTFGSAMIPLIITEAGAAVTKEERAAARSAVKARRAECKAQANAQRLHFLKRARFTRACMRKTG